MAGVMAQGSGPRRSNALLLLIANLLLPLSILVFGVGFFPYKPYLPGLAHYEKLTYGDPPNAPFDRLVFMVVDALRRSILNLNHHKDMGRSCFRIADTIYIYFSDFVFSQESGFEYTQR